MKIIFVFSCSGMFRNVPCSGFYRRPVYSDVNCEQRKSRIVWVKNHQAEGQPLHGKSFEKNCILRCYYICVHHEGTICKNLYISLYLYSDFVIEYVSSIVMQSNWSSYDKYVYLPINSSLLTEYCYMHFNNYFVEHIRENMRWGGHHVNIK